jgi:hypothetical protein
METKEQGRESGKRDPKLTPVTVVCCEAPERCCWNKVPCFSAIKDKIVLI